MSRRHLLFLSFYHILLQLNLICFVSDHDDALCPTFNLDVVLLHDHRAIFSFRHQLNVEHNRFLIEGLDYLIEGEDALAELRHANRFTQVQFVAAHFFGHFDYFIGIQLIHAPITKQQMLGFL